MFRSGGYEMNDELEDATFAFGRTAEEVKRHPKARMPTGLVNLLTVSYTHLRAHET